MHTDIQDADNQLASNGTVEQAIMEPSGLGKDQPTAVDDNFTDLEQSGFNQEKEESSSSATVDPPEETLPGISNEVVEHEATPSAEEVSEETNAQPLDHFQSRVPPSAGLAVEKEGVLCEDISKGPWPLKKDSSMELAQKLALGKKIHNENNPMMSKILGWNFYRSVLTHLIITSLGVGGIMKAVNYNLGYLDCLFLIASAVSGTGLATVSMATISLPGLILLYMVMFLGSGTLIQLMALIFRM